MIRTSSPRSPRSIARTQLRLTRKRRWTRRNSLTASRSSSLSMPRIDAWRRPSSVASHTSLPSASAKRTSFRCRRTIRSPRTPTMRDGALIPRSGASVSAGPPVPDPNTASVPTGWSARNTGRSVMRRGSDVSPVAMCVEPIQPRSRRACLVAWRVSRERSSAGRQRTVGSSAGTRAGTPSRRLASSSAMTTLPLASRAASAWPDRALAWANAAASSAPLSRARWRRIARTPLTALDSQPAARAGQPPRRLRGQVVAPGRAVEDRDGVVGHRVTNGDAAADPLVEAVAPVLGPADQHRPRRLERGAHPVGPGRPFRPARPRRHVGLARAAQRVRVSLDGEDPPEPVGDGDDAAEALDLGRDRRGGPAEVGEHDLVLERVLGRGLVVGGRRRGGVEAGVDVVLLATSVPRRGDLRPDSAHSVVTGEEALPRGGDRPIAIRVTGAMRLDGAAHGATASLRWITTGAPWLAS